jgi:hypothetical protein
MDSRRIIETVEAVTKKWAKQRKAEERSASNAARRRHALVRSARKTIKDAAWAAMPAAYLHASNDNQYPAHARQVMYAARGPIQEATGERLDDQYFTQTLLPDYLRENPQTTADWDVVFDARGHFAEPHTGVIVPLGTIDVREYLRRMRGEKGRKEDRVRRRAPFPTAGAANRFAAVLFIEKEGFLPLFRRTLLAERFDIAIMSTKGVSVTAARRLVDELSGQGVPCLVLRDFDKAGFTIVHTLQADGRRYVFQQRPTVIDLGLRLEDVQGNHLASEDVSYGKSDPTENLLRNGATPEEIAYLCSEGPQHGYAGQRVELNAFTSGDLIAWIEGKLEEKKVKKVVPDREVLLQAYRLAYEQQLLRRRMRQVCQEVHEVAQGIKLPKDLAAWVKGQVKRDRAQPWDRAVNTYASRRIEQAESME